MSRTNRGLTREMLEYVWRVLFLLVIFAVLAVLVQVFIANKLDVQETARQTLFDRIYYSSAIWEINELGRPVIGTIQLNNFSTSRLEQSISYTAEQHIAAKVVVATSESMPDFETTCTSPTSSHNPPSWARTIYLNKKAYEVLCPLAPVSQSGGTTMLTKKIPITVKTGNTVHEGMLLIQIVTPNS